MRRANPKARAARRGLVLEYTTIGWNVGEAAITLALGSHAGSLALIAFGSVSVIEIFASGVVVWHLRKPPGDPGRSATALRLVATAFAFLSAALIITAIRDIVTGRRPGESVPGIAYLAAATIAMFLLAHAKRGVAGTLDDSPLRREAVLTQLDGFLSAATMLGLLLNAAAGWWWADPSAALLVALAALTESREAFEEAGEVRDQGRVGVNDDGTG